MLLQWELYDKARHGKYYNWDFPWWDSDKLEKLYPDKNTRRQALLFFWYLPKITFDMKAFEEYNNVLKELYSEKKITKDIKNDLFMLELWGYCDIGHPPYIARSKEDVIKFVRILEDEGKIEESVAERLIELIEQTPFRFKRFGIDGAEFALKQAFEEYKKVSYYLDHPTENISKCYSRRGYTSWYEIADERYNEWLGDRFNHGLSYTVGQYVGLTDEQVKYLKQNWSRDLFTKWYNELNGLDQYLIKNWRYWDLVKFIAGYERWNPNAVEVFEIQYITPQVLRMFGFPIERLGINPTPKGAGGREWAVTLPDYLANEIKNRWDNQVLIGPGNIFGLHSCKYGLIKDGISKVFVRVDSSQILVYLMKKILENKLIKTLKKF